MPIPYAPTCSRCSAALATYAENRDCPRCPGNSLSAGDEGRSLSNSRARKLTEPLDAVVARRAGSVAPAARVGAGLKLHPSLLHGDECRPRPCIVLLLREQMPGQRGDLARRRDGSDLLALAAVD